MASKTLHPKPTRKPPPPDRWTEARVFEMLKGPFPDGAYVRLPQVRNGTGWQSRTRTCDALIVSCWPSRGLWFAGVEIKVCPADWKRELARPDKSDAIQKWCNYWYVAAPAGVVPIGELPPTWGLIECTSRGCSIKKPAPKLKAKPPDSAFVCSVLRNISGSMVPRMELDALAEKRAEEKLERRQYEIDKLREDVARFEKETGISIRHTWSYGDVAQALKLVRDSKIQGVKGLAEYMKREAQRLVRSGCEVIALCDQALADPEGGDSLGPFPVDD